MLEQKKIRPLAGRLRFLGQTRIHSQDVFPGPDPTSRGRVTGGRMVH